MKKSKKYDVGVEVKFLHSVVVSGKTKSEIKKKAFEKFKNKLKISDFNFYIDEIDY